MASKLAKHREWTDTAVREEMFDYLHQNLGHDMCWQVWDKGNTEREMWRIQDEVA